MINLKKCCAIVWLIGLVILSLGVVEGAQIIPGLDGGKKLTLKLDSDEVAIFGYGSLMLKETLHCNDKNECDDEPYVMAKLNGFKRSWSVQYPNDYYGEFFNWEEGKYFTPPTTTCLNIEPSEGSKVNGVLFVCSKEELESYDEREFSYDRIEINDLLEDVSIMGGKAYAYTAKPDYFRPSEEELPETTVIPLSYVEIIEKALYRLGKDFAIEYHQSTQSLPLHLIF